MKAAIIGCGNIGTSLAALLEKQSEIELVAIVDENRPAALRLQGDLRVNHPQILPMDKAIELADLIIESANPAAVQEILKLLSHRSKSKKLLVMSTGGLIDQDEMLARMSGCEIHLPSGAIAGLDAIQAAAGEIDSLELTTTKPPDGLKDSPYVKDLGLDLFALKEKKIIFKGSIFDAVKNFPQNINVAASLYLASGFREIKVSIAVDPAGKVNSHEIICNGKFGTIHTVTQNLPSKNPKTSYLALLSAQRTLENIDRHIKIGC